MTIDGATAVYDLQTVAETVGDVSLLNGGSLTAGSSFTMGNFTSTAGSLTLNGTCAGTVTLKTNANLNLSGGTWLYTAGVLFIAANSASFFSLNEVTFDLTGINSGNYQLTSGFASSGNKFGSYTITGISNPADATVVNDSSVLTLTVVPEPSTYALSILGCVGLPMMVCRRRRALQ